MVIPFAFYNSNYFTYVLKNLPTKFKKKTEAEILKSKNYTKS